MGKRATQLHCCSRTVASRFAFRTKNGCAIEAGRISPNSRKQLKQTTPNRPCGTFYWPRKVHAREICGQNQRNNKTETRMFKCKSKSNLLRAFWHQVNFISAAASNIKQLRAQNGRNAVQVVLAYLCSSLYTQSIDHNDQVSENSRDDVHLFKKC